MEIEKFPKMLNAIFMIFEIQEIDMDALFFRSLKIPTVKILIFE